MKQDYSVKDILNAVDDILKVKSAQESKKKTKPITIGDIIFPSKIPNWIHNLFKNVNKLGLIIVVIKNTKDKTTDQTLMAPPVFNG